MSETEEKKNKKINKMSVAELEEAVNKTKEKMGGLTSRYGFRLEKRLQELKG